ncbi:hypothetical protein L7F22_008964 [Adiantum nelumboides]|nr:hypothetical protein [Adiantum nelumboides]
MARKKGKNATSAVVAGVFLVFNFALYAAILGISAWAINGLLDGKSDVQGSNVTFTFVPVALLAGIVGVASVFVGLLLLKAWNSETLATSIAIGYLALLFSCLAVGFAIKDLSVKAQAKSVELVTPAASCLKTLVANTLMEEGTISGSKQRKLLLGSPTIDSKSPFKVSWKDLEEHESKMNFSTMGSNSKKLESKGKKITLFPKGIVKSVGKSVPKSSSAIHGTMGIFSMEEATNCLAKEGSSASHGTMGIFSVEEATNCLVDLSKFLQTQDEALSVLENAKLEHKCNVVLEGEMQKINMQLFQEKLDKEKLHEELTKFIAEAKAMTTEIFSVAEDFHQSVDGLKIVVDEQLKNWMRRWLL